MPAIRKSFNRIERICFGWEDKLRRESSAGRTAGKAKDRNLGAEGGAVLLEVILALALFVLAATIITSGLSSSVNEVKRLRLNTHASNLAVSVLSQMQMGIQAGEASGPNAFDPPFEQWKWQTILSPVNEMVGATNPIQKVEVIIRNDSEPVVYRLTQFLPVVATGSPSTPANSLPPAGNGF